VDQGEVVVQKEVVDMWAAYVSSKTTSVAATITLFSTRFAVSGPVGGRNVWLPFTIGGTLAQLTRGAAAVPVWRYDIVTALGARILFIRKQ
jgi:hypothetical protein